MVLALQREVGSRGSGAFQTMPGFRDIAPAANGLVRIQLRTDAANDQFRLKVTTDTSGTIVYAMFDGRLTPRTFTKSTHKNRFDEFDGSDEAQLGDTTWQTEWLTFTNADGTDMQFAAEVEEGAMDMTAGTGGTIAQDVVAMSYTVVVNDGALVSDGITQVTWRVRQTLLVASSWGYGMNDVVAVNAALPLFTWDTNLVVDTGTTDSIAIGGSSDSAAGAALWQVGSTNAGAVGNNDDEFACESAVVINTYYRLTIEVESSGDAFFYVDDVLCAAEPLAIATAARLVPYAWATSGTDTTTGGTVVTVDYVDFWMPRPSN